MLFCSLTNMPNKKHSDKSPLATDFGIHQNAPQKFLVFQDGHVAKMTFKIFLNALRERAGIPIFSNPN